MAEAEKKPTILVVDDAFDKLSTVLNHAGSGITVIALRGVKPEFLYANDRFFEIVGYSREAYAHITTDDMLAPVHPEDRELTRRQILDCNQKHDDTTIEYRVLRADGKTVWVRTVVTVTSLEEVAGPVQIAVYTDVTAEKERAAQLRFLNDSAHDILAQPDSENAIRGAVDKLLRYFAAARCYVVECDSEKHLARLSYGSDKDGRQNEPLPFDPDSPWYHALAEGRYYLCPAAWALAQSIPGSGGRERGVRSLILAPLRRDGQLLGWVGADDPQAAVDQVQGLTALADYIAVLLTRRDLDRELARNNATVLEQESQLKLLTNNLPGGIATFLGSPSGQLTLTYFNDGYCGLSGHTRDEYGIMTSDPLRVVYPEDKPLVEAEIQTIMAAEHAPVDFIFRIVTKNGGYRWVNCQAIAGEPVADKLTLYVMLTDITQSHEEKERLRVSEEFNRLAIEQSGNIITKFEVAQRKLILPDSFNPIFVLPPVLTGMPEEQISLGRVSPDTAASYRRLFNDIIAGSPAGNVTYKQNSSKGWRWLEAHYTTIFASSGQPVSAVVSFTDITEKLEQEVVYNKWQQSLVERPKDSYTLFRCNLNKEAAYDSREGGLLTIVFEPKDGSFDQRTAEYAAAFVYGEDRERYLAFMNAGALLAEYYRGRRSASLEYREIISGEQVRWLRLSVDLVEYPSSRDVEAYLMYEDIDQHKRAELLTLARAEKDPLTGILNRATFIGRMESILRDSPPQAQHALFVLDVDNFKFVNDSLGHGAGDLVLREMTGQINAILRRDDLLGRLGGDEFFIFLRNIPGPEIAEAKARQICALQIAAPGAKATITASIGIAMIPQDGQDFDTLYKKADKALYQQKAHGKNGYLFVSD